MPEMIKLSGAAVHSVFLRTTTGLLLATVRGRGVELRSVPQSEVVDSVLLDSTVHAVAALPQADGTDLLVVGGADGLACLFQPGQAQPLVRQQLDGGEIHDLSVFVTEDGQPVTAVLYQGGIQLWRDGAGRRLPGSDGRRGAQPFRVTTFRSGGQRWLAAAYDDGAIAVWQLNDPDREPTWNGNAHAGQVWTMIAVDRHNVDQVLATGSADGTARIWGHDGGGRLSIARTFPVGSTVRRLAYLIDNDVPMLVAGSAGGTVAIRRFDGPEDQPMRTVAHLRGEVWSLAAAHIGDGAVVIASGGQHGQVLMSRLQTNVLSRDTARTVLTCAGAAWMAAVGATADVPYAAIGGVDATIRVRHLGGDGDTLHLAGHRGTIRALAGSSDPDTPVLASGGADGRVLVWDPATGQRICELGMGHQGEVWALCVTTLNGVGHVVSAGNDGTVRISRIAPHATIRTLATGCGGVEDVLAVPNGGDVLIVIASNRGLRVVSAAGTGSPVPVTLQPVAAACLAHEAGRPVVVTVRSEAGYSVFELFDPVGRNSVGGFRHAEPDVNITCLAATEVGGELLIVGGADDGRLRAWHISGGPVGRPEQAGPAAIRSIALTTAAGTGAPALISADDQGTGLLWPIATGTLLRGGGTIGADVSARPIMLQDQPSDADELSRTELVQTIRDVLMAEDTEPPVVVGIHAPWGMGKSSVLRQLRKLLESTAQPDDGATHQLVPPDDTARPGRWRRAWQGGEVRTRLTRSWAWRQTRRTPAPGAALPYRMRPSAGAEAITIWFNPWMYERPDQLWAGLTHEILQAISSRLPQRQRQRLWFDLNLRRTDPAAIRRRILTSFLPETLLGILGWPTLLLLAVVAVVAGVVTTVNSQDPEALFGTSTWIVLTVLGVLAQLGFAAFRQVRGWVDPSVLAGPSAGGITGSGARNWHGDDPLQQAETGYLYLLQHDVREVVELARQHSTIIVFIDDLDRCSPPVVANTIEAINLFLNKVFDPCMFVIALDPATVAAQLDSQFSAITQRAETQPAAHGHLRQTGWRFMEKIVDLPIRLPRIRDVALDDFLDRLLDTEPHATAPASTPVIPRQRTGPPAADGRADSGTSTVRSGSGRWARSADTDPGPGSVQTRPAGVSTATATAINRIEELERLAPVRLALRSAVRALPQRNPRQTKAFLNLWRFYMVLEHRTRQLHYNLADLEQHSIEMARFVELIVRWPWLVDALAAQHDDIPGSQRSLLTCLLEHCDDDGDWSRTLAAAGIRPDDEDMSGLRALLSRPGTDPDKFARIANRYL